MLLGRSQVSSPFEYPDLVFQFRMRSLELVQAVRCRRRLTHDHPPGVGVSAGILTNEPRAQRSRPQDTGKGPSPEVNPKSDRELSRAGRGTFEPRYTK